MAASEPLKLPPMGPWLGNSKKVIYDALYGPSKDLPRNSQGYEPIEAYFPHLNPDYKGPKAFDSDTDSDEELRRHNEFIEKRKKELLEARERKRQARAREIKEKKRLEKLKQDKERSAKIARLEATELATEIETITAQEPPPVSVPVVTKEQQPAAHTPTNTGYHGDSPPGGTYTKTAPANKTLPTITQDEMDGENALGASFTKTSATNKTLPIITQDQEEIIDNSPLGDSYTKAVPTNKTLPTITQDEDDMDGEDALGTSFTKASATNKTLPKNIQEEVTIDPKSDNEVPTCSYSAEQSLIAGSQPSTADSNVQPSRLSFGSDGVLDHGKPEVRKSRRKSNVVKKVVQSQSTDTDTVESEATTSYELPLISKSRDDAISHEPPLNSTSISTIATTRKGRLRSPANWAFSSIRPKRTSRALKRLEATTSKSLEVTEKPDEQQAENSDSSIVNMDVATHLDESDAVPAHEGSPLECSPSTVKLKRLSIDMVKMSPEEIVKKTKKRKQPRLTYQRNRKSKSSVKRSSVQGSSRTPKTAAHSSKYVTPTSSRQSVSLSPEELSHIELLSAHTSPLSKEQPQSSKKNPSKKNKSVSEVVSPPFLTKQKDYLIQLEPESPEQAEDEQPLADVSILGKIRRKRQKITQQKSSKRSKVADLGPQEDTDSDSDSDAEVTQSPVGGREYRRHKIEATKKTPGVRRSRRNRIAPVKPWLNEKVEYEMRRKSGITLKAVLYPTYPDEAPRPKSRTSKRKKAQEESPVTDDCFGPLLIEYENGESSNFQVVRTLASAETVDIDGKTATEDSDIIVHRVISSEEGNTGFMTFKSMAMKKTSLAANHQMDFLVLSGKLLFCVDDNEYVLKPEMTARVPPDCQYSVTNIGLGVAKLYFHTLSME